MIDTKEAMENLGAAMSTDVTDPEGDAYDPVAAREMRRDTDRWKLYDLGIGETTQLCYKTVEATRVPGGWLFRRIDEKWDMVEGRETVPGNAMFVPFSDEFNPNEGEK
jgi:hypothetical protein